MDHIELQIINKTSTRSSSEDYERYCCICLNTNYDTFIKFDCCRQSIHQECFVKMILTNIDVKCPTCRCVYNKIIRPRLGSYFPRSVQEHGHSKVLKKAV